MFNKGLKISIHAPRVGSDGDSGSTVAKTLKFQSTLPVWGATIYCCLWLEYTYISIHAPRVGSDDIANDLNARGINFNPRSPCGERRKSIPLLGR